MKTQTNHNRENREKQGRQSRNTDKPDIKKIIAMRRALLITCALAYGQDQTCVDDPNWVKNGDEPWKDCAWVAEYIPTRCSVRGADGASVVVGGGREDRLEPRLVVMDSGGSARFL